MKNQERAPSSYSYEKYRSQKECLDKESYTTALKAVADNITQVNQTFIQNAEFISTNSDIKLSPETLALYAILRKDSDASMGDQQLLAEILYYQEEYETLNKLIKFYPSIFSK